MKKYLDILRKNQHHKLLVYGIGQAFNLITPLLVIPYIVSVCGESGFGKIGVGMAVAFFLIVIVDYGSDIIGVKTVSVERENKERLSGFLSTVYVSKLVLLAGVFIVASAVFMLIPYFSVDKDVFFLSLAIVVGQFINPTWIFQGIEDFKAITILNVVSKIIYVAGVFIFIKTPGDYIYANFLWGIGMIVANSGAFIYLTRQYPIGFSKTSFAEVKNFLAGNFSISCSQVFLSLQLNLPIILIDFFAGSGMAGKYKIVEQIVVIFKTYIFLFFNFVFPRVCYLLDKNIKEGLRYWKIYNGLNFIFIALSMAALYILAEPVVAYFKPPSLGEISELLRLGIFIPLVLCISVSLKQLVLGWNHNTFYIRLTMAMVLLSLVSITLLLPYYGIRGALATLIIADAATAILYLIPIKEKLFRTN